MTVYYYYVGNPPNIAALVVDLDAKILVDLDLPLVDYGFTVYNALSENVEITFTNPLNDFDVYILDAIANIILFDYIPGDNVYVPPSQALFYRTSLNVTGDPSVNNDYQSGYAPYSVITTTNNDIYINNGNTIGSATWVKLNSSALIPYSLISDTNITILSRYFPMAFGNSIVPALDTGITSPTIMNATSWKVPRSGSIAGISGSVGLDTLDGSSAGGTINYTFTIFKASALDSSTVVPTFSNVGSVTVPIIVPTTTTAGILFNSDSEVLTVTVSKGDLIVVAVSIDTLITADLNTPALSLTAGLNII